MTRLLTLGGATIVFVYLATSSLFTVDDSQLALVTRFGEPVRQVSTGGLAIKWPDPIENVTRIDKRLHLLDGDVAEYLTRDNKNLVAASFVLWRVKDAQKFVESVKRRATAERRLVDLASSELGAAVGQSDLSAFFTIAPTGNRIAEIMAGVTESTNRQAELDFGIEVTDVRLRRLGFPEETVRSIYNRMQVEREKIAKQHRAEGEEQAARIRIQTDKEVREILATAYRQAQITKGEAEARAIRIYADAFEKDPEFYRLIRTLDAYQEIIDDKTTLILSADSRLFQYLEAPPEMQP